MGMDVIVYKWALEKDANCTEKVEDGWAKFHAWGVDFQNCEFGVGTYSAAIVERKDGRVELVPAEMIKFIKSE